MSGHAFINFTIVVYTKIKVSAITKIVAFTYFGMNFTFAFGCLSECIGIDCWGGYFLKQIVLLFTCGKNKNVFKNKL